MRALAEERSRVERVAQEAGDVFWDKVAELYPEIKTGDLDPPATHAFREACALVLVSWLYANTPGEEFVAHRQDEEIDPAHREGGVQ